MVSFKRIKVNCIIIALLNILSFVLSGCSNKEYESEERAFPAEEYYSVSEGEYTRPIYNENQVVI